MGSTSTFGAPSYGDRMIGRLLYGKPKDERAPHCSDEDYQIPRRMRPTSESREDEESLSNIVVVKRGGCPVAVKVMVAQKYKEAHAVIIVDSDDSQLTEKTVLAAILSDRGESEDHIDIPSLLVDKNTGKTLIDAISKQTVIASLEWDLPRSSVVGVDFWMSSGSREAHEFLVSFAPVAALLKNSIQFTPHYHIFSMDSNYNEMCIDDKQRYCGLDPDGPGPVTGMDVVMESVRQVCLWQLTRERQHHNVMYSQTWWDYVTELPSKCRVDATHIENRFGYRCSQQLLSAKVRWADLADCSNRQSTQILHQEAKEQAWSPVALRINGLRYAGPLEAYTVSRAICSSFVRAPPECKELVRNQEFFQRRQISKSMGFLSIVLAFLLIAFCVFFILMAYKRYISRTIRSNIRDEVLMEVRTQMAEYRPLQESDARPPARF